ncbi:MAG: beta-galactosidase [Lentisphaerae bacterium]|nr:beta-galactosidase [Lentisphaerota bacterium]
MKYRGAAYYPEVWQKERWDTDIEMMREAHINIVRMGEFAWSRFEPRDGEFDLEWWRDICGRLRDAGIKILACTPSAAPPAWLTKKYPETLLVFENDKPAVHGSRRHYCQTSPVYRELIERVNRAIAQSVKNNESVIAWQIDNEIALEPYQCFCPRCAEGFRSWLKHRYHTLDALNEAWGNGFWSGDFSSWDEILPPRHRVSWKLDYRRFQDDMFAEFIKRQADILRSINSNWKITTNQWTGPIPAGDTIKYFDPLDFASFDGYWNYYQTREFHSSVWDFYRNIKIPARPFWVAETNAWNPSSTVTGGLLALRPWAYQAFAKGSEAHFYFRWRQSRMGEEDHPAILDWSGTPSRAYYMIKDVFGEFENLAPELNNLPLPDAKAAVLFDYDSGVCGELEKRDYRNRLMRASILLGRMHVLSDMLPVRPGVDISKYRLLILPQTEMIDPWFAEELKKFVKSGGTVLAITRLSTLDRNGKYITDPIPGNLTDLFGMTIREHWPIHAQSPNLEHSIPDITKSGESCIGIALKLQGSKNHKSLAVEYMELPEIDRNTRVLGTYKTGTLKGFPAVTELKYGKGSAIYQACRMDEKSETAILRYALKQSGAGRPVNTPPEVEILRRGQFDFYLNHGDKPVILKRLTHGKTLIGKADSNHVRLDAFGVCITKNAK